MKLGWIRRIRGPEVARRCEELLSPQGATGQSDETEVSHAVLDKALRDEYRDDMKRAQYVTNHIFTSD